MASVTIPRAITPRSPGAPQQQLSTGYQVTPHGNDSLTVKYRSLAYATVHLHQDGDATTFRVGGGLVVGRIVNESGIARAAAATINEAVRTVPDSSGPG